MWNDLTMSERADVIKMAVKAGLRDMKSIRDFYDNSLKYADGDSKPGMTGMMKSKLAIASHFGNPTARRMTNYDTRNYTFPNRYDEETGLQEIGNVYVSSYDNLVTPQIQDNGKELEFVPEEKVWDKEHDPRSYAQSIKFYGPNADKDARYFGEHYKEVAPMMNLYADGGPKVTLVDNNKVRISPSGTFSDDNGNIIGDSVVLPEIEVQGLRSDAYTVPNDNLWVNNGRVKNPELTYRGEYGAKSHALWEKEHPTLTKWGYVASAAPFAVAAAPIAPYIGMAGDALAATSVGNTITSGLGTMSSYITAPTLLGAPAYAWGDAALTSAFATHGINSAIEEGDVSPETLLEVAPMLQLSKPVTSTGSKTLKSITRKISKQLNAEERARDLRMLAKGTITSPYKMSAYSNAVKDMNESNDKLRRFYNLTEKVKAPNRAGDTFDASDNLPKWVIGMSKNYHKQVQSAALKDIIADGEIPNYGINYSKASGEDILNFLQKNTDKDLLSKIQLQANNGELFITNPGGLNFSPIAGLEPTIKTGKINIVDASTGKTKEFFLDPSVFNKDGYKTYKFPSTKPIKESVASAIYPEAPKDYLEAVQKNIDFVTKDAVPGSKVFGSSANVVKGNLYHDAHDIDVLITQEDAMKHPKFKEWYSPNGGDTYKYNHPTAGELDVNVIKQDGNGMATGQRAHELYAQLYPKEYSNLLKSIGEKSPSTLENINNIPLDKTPKELLDAYDPVTKTIVDAFSSRKPKHMQRATYFLHYGNVNDVNKGFKQYANYILGGDYKSSGIPLDSFKNPIENGKIIDALGLKGINKEQFINDPERMKLLFEYEYFQEGFLGRGVATPEVRDNLIKSFTHWYPENNGGTVRGVGLNTVLGGNSGHGNVYGVLVPEKLGMQVATKDPIEALKIRRELLGAKNLSSEDLNKIESIANKHNVKLGIPTSFKEVLADTSGREGQNYKDFLSDLEDEFGIAGIKGNYYNDLAEYVSPTKDIPKSGLKQLMIHGMDRPISSKFRDALASRTANQGLDIDYINSELGSNRLRNIERKAENLTAPLSVGSMNDWLLKGLRTRNQKAVDKVNAVRSAISEINADRVNKLSDKLDKIKENKAKIKLGGKVISTGAAAALLGYWYNTLPKRDAKAGREARRKARAEKEKLAATTPKEGKEEIVK